jgi:DNA polymerase I-like protein with 3'-5' exonuclease and polymerase domains
MSEDKLFIITTLDKLNQVYDYVLDNLPHVDFLAAYDTESNGRCPITNEIIGFSLSLFDTEGFYFPFLTMTDERGLCTESPNPIPKEGQNLTNTLVECVTPAFKARAMELLAELTKAKLLMHNATFDVIITRRNFGVDYVKSVYCDTMLLKHTIDCDRPHGLKDCGARYFGEDSKNEQVELGGSVLRNGGKWTSKDKWIWHGDLYYVGTYACRDTILTLKLFNHLDPQLDALELRPFFYEDEVMPLLRYGTIPMKDTGFKIDVGHFKRAKLRLQAEIDDLETQLRAEITDITGNMEQEHLDKRFPHVPKRDYAQTLILEVGLSLPINPKTGEFSTVKKIIAEWAGRVIRTATEDKIKVIWFMQEECDKVPVHLIHRVQRILWDDKEACPIVNIGSPKQFEYIITKKWGLTSPNKTKGGDQQWNADVIEMIAVKRMQDNEGLTEIEAKERFEELMEGEELPKEADWFCKYLRMKKLEKLVTAFIDGILELQIDGRIHSNLNQAGTQSGRYSSNNPNLQQIPAHSALGSVVKRGFIC